MKRTVPHESSDEITLYMRTYYSLLRSSDEVQIRTLRETHIGMNSSLHPGADEIEPDMSAFIYSSLRLPDCMAGVRLVVLGQTQEVFHRRGYPDIENWQPVTAAGRRRRMAYDGKETLAAYIASLSDIDDIIPILVAFQIEWNKMHALIALQSGLSERLQHWAAHGTHDSELREETRQVLRLSFDDWNRLENLYGARFPKIMGEIASSRKKIAVRLLAGTHVDYRRATQQWWEHIIAAQAGLELHQRPVYFVSSNTHSLINMLTGFARRQEGRLRNYLGSTAGADLREEFNRIERGEVRSNPDNFRYYLLKKYMATPEGQDLKAERNAHEQRCGIVRIPSHHTFDLEAQIIDIARLIPADLDPRLQDLPLQRLAASRALIFNIDYPLGFAAYHLLSQIASSVGELCGTYFIGKAATLNGQVGDVLIPNVVYDEHSENTYMFENIFRAADVSPYLVYGDVLDNQRAITVRGTFLQNQPYMTGFHNAGYTDVEMEAGPYLSALYEFIRPRRYPTDELVNLYPIPFEVGALHYASDTPMSKGKNLGARNLSYYGMDPTYAATVAVLRRILTLETAES